MLPVSHTLVFVYANVCAFISKDNRSDVPCVCVCVCVFVLQDVCPSWNRPCELLSCVPVRCLMDSSTLLQSLWQVSGDGCRGNSPAERWVFTVLSVFFRLG